MARPADTVPELARLLTRDGVHAQELFSGAENAGKGMHAIVFDIPEDATYYTLCRYQSDSRL